MSKHSLYSIVRKKNKTTQEQSTIAENLLARDFTADEPGKKFVTDITYIPTPRCMAYLCTELNVNQSMSRKGNCWDNAPAESFFGHFKCESIYLMKNQIKNYMDYYINDRPQKSLGGLTPKGYMQQHKLVA